MPCHVRSTGSRREKEGLSRSGGAKNWCRRGRIPIRVLLHRYKRVSIRRRRGWWSSHGSSGNESGFISLDRKGRGGVDRSGGQIDILRDRFPSNLSRGRIVTKALWRSAAENKRRRHETPWSVSKNSHRSTVAHASKVERRQKGKGLLGDIKGKRKKKEKVR